MMKLLIVDDNEQNLYMLQKLLEGNGHEVLLAADGEEALKIARVQAPGMIISDILMPRMDGFTLCREWKKDPHLREIPFAFYTATYTDPKDEEFALKLGAERFIIKPVEPEEFLEILNGVIEEHKNKPHTAPQEPIREDPVFLKEYSERLIKKLEDKMLQLEEKNRALEEEIEKRCRAEKELVEHREKLRALAAQLSRVEDQERRKLANALHDTVGQTLAMSNMQLGYLCENVSDPELSSTLHDIHTMLRQATQDAQSLTFELCPPMLYEIGLEHALSWLAEQIQEKHGVSIRFKDDGEPKPLDGKMRASIFTAVRELIYNVIKHAKATEVSMNVKREEEAICITVLDNGVGFSMEKRMKQKSQISGFGLFSITERIHYLGGSFQLDSQPGNGTKATLVMPLCLEPA